MLPGRCRCEHGCRTVSRTTCRQRTMSASTVAAHTTSVMGTASFLRTAPTCFDARAQCCKLSGGLAGGQRGSGEAGPQPDESSPRRPALQGRVQSLAWAVAGPTRLRAHKVRPPASLASSTTERAARCSFGWAAQPSTDGSGAETASPRLPARRAALASPAVSASAHRPRAP